MDKRSPEDIRRSIKSLVEEAESVSVNMKRIEDEKPESKLDSVSIDLENKYKKNIIKRLLLKIT